MNKQIKNIIFDWGGVLIDLNLEGCISAFEQAGAVNVRNLLTGTNELGFFRDYECGNISTLNFVQPYVSTSANRLPMRKLIECGIWNCLQFLKRSSICLLN